MEISLQIRRFLDGEGRITQLPRKLTVRRDVLAYLATKFEYDTDYREREVNDICECWHTFGDFFLLRRELVDYGLLGREPNGSRYWRIRPDSPDES